MLRNSPPLEEKKYRGLSYLGGDFSGGDPTNDPAVQLLFRADLQASSRLLLLGGGCGAIQRTLQDRFETIRVVNFMFQDDLASRLGAERFADRSVTEFRLDSLLSRKAAGSGWQTILYRMGREGGHALAVSLHALSVLKSGGIFHFLGSNRDGVRTVAGRLVELLGHPQDEFQAKGSRLYSWCMESVPTSVRERFVELTNPVVQQLETSRGNVFCACNSGVFSRQKVDVGTAVLLNHLPELQGRKVLDLGCGTGVLGMVAIHEGAAECHFRDANMEAVCNTQENLEKNGLDATVDCGFMATDLGREFDLILSNPPFHTGRTKNLQMGKRWLESSHAVLAEGGEMILVANSFLPYLRFAKERFASCRSIVEKNGYSLYHLRKNA